MRAKNGSLVTYTTESYSNNLLEIAQTLEHELIVRQVDSSRYQLQMLEKAIKNEWQEKEKLREQYA